MAIPEKISGYSKNLFLASILILMTAVTFSTSIVEIAACVSIFFFIILFFSNRKEYFHPNTLDYILILYLVIAFSSIFYSAFPDQSLRAFFSKALKGAGVYFVARNYFTANKGKIKHIAAVFFITAIVISMDGFFQYVFGKDFIRGFSLDVFFKGAGELETRRITASMKYPNNLGVYLAFIIPISVTVFLKLKNISLRILAGCGILLIIGALLLTYSRSSWLALFIAIIFMIVFMKNKKFILILLPLFIFILLMPKTSTMIRSAQPGRIIDDSIKGRVRYTRDAIDVIKINPVFGSGINTYDSLNKKIHPGREIYPYAHNCYLQMWAELGLIGLLAFLSFICVLFSKTFKFLKKSAENELRPFVVGISAGVMVLLISFIFDTHFYNSTLSVLFWASCGILAGIVQYGKNREI